MKTIVLVLSLILVAAALLILQEWIMRQSPTSQSVKQDVKEKKIVIDIEQIPNDYVVCFKLRGNEVCNFYQSWLGCDSMMNRPGSIRKVK